MKVLVYSTPTCPYCKQVKKYLDEHMIQYEDLDVSKSADLAREMVQKSGQRGVPVIDINGKIVLGFDREKLNQLLDIK